MRHGLPVMILQELVHDSLDFLLGGEHLLRRTISYADQLEIVAELAASQIVLTHYKNIHRSTNRLNLRSF